MSMNRAIGAAIFAVGVVLLIFGLNATDAPMEQVSETLTGKYSDNTMWYMIGGAAALIGGAVLFALGRKA